MKITSTLSKPLYKVVSHDKNKNNDTNITILDWEQKEKVIKRPDGWRQAIGKHIASNILWWLMATQFYPNIPEDEEGIDIEP
jgi:hypothetical protein